MNIAINKKMQYLADKYAFQNPHAFQQWPLRNIMNVITRKNHYNPCFWTAYWNSDYYNIKTSGEEERCRQVIVNYLNFDTNKIYCDKTKNVFFEKSLGVIEFTSKDMLRYLQDNNSSEYFKLKEKLSRKDLNDKFIWDYENHFTQLEKTDAYLFLDKLIRKKSIESDTEQGIVAGFIIFHFLRNHVTLNSWLEMKKNQGESRLNSFITINQLVRNTDFIYNIAMNYINGNWKLYRTSTDKFPLNDNPILFNDSNIMVSLSPRLLLEIERNSNKRSVEHIDGIPNFKLSEYMDRLINNTFRGIVFSNQTLLNELKNSKTYMKRLKILKDANSYNKQVGEHMFGELYIINAYSNGYGKSK